MPGATALKRMPSFAYRTHEEDRPFATQSSRTHLELLPCSKATFQRRRGGLEQQGQSHYEKIVRLSNLPRPRTRPLSLTWQAARAGVHPRFLLTSLKMKGPGSFERRTVRFD